MSTLGTLGDESLGGGQIGTHEIDPAIVIDGDDGTGLARVTHLPDSPPERERE